MERWVCLSLDVGVGQQCSSVCFVWRCVRVVCEINVPSPLALLTLSVEIQSSGLRTLQDLDLDL